jgi:uncharacterized protein YndB with AHSA1/START domain
MPSAKNEIPTNAQPRPLTAARTSAATPELVFQAWSPADHVQHWFCPSG